jgi:hypothetical protein
MDPELIALATTAGTAVATAVGTDAWHGLRAQVARLFRHGHAPEAAEQEALAHLDSTAAELAQAAPDTAEQARDAAADLWAGHFRALLGELEALSEEQQAGVVTSLQALRAAGEAGKVGAAGQGPASDPTDAAGPMTGNTFTFHGPTAFMAGNNNRQDVHFGPQS